MKETRNIGTRQTTRRIVVSDKSATSRPESVGRRLENPPAAGPIRTHKTSGLQLSALRVRKFFLVAGVSVVVGALLVVVVVLALKPQPPTTVREQPKQEKLSEPSQSEPVKKVSRESDELRRIEEDAKQVIRSISRDDKPYGFSERAVNDIQSRVVELSRKSRVAESLANLQTNGASLGSQADKVGLQASLVMLLGLALSNGGDTGAASTAAAKALPLLTSLNKSFGSSEADSCLILVAAFREGPGSQRSHPLLRRMNKAVNNPLTERNIWYLKEQNVISSEAYGLAVDTIAWGIIARNPRQFGIQADPLSF